MYILIYVYIWNARGYSWVFWENRWFKHKAKERLPPQSKRFFQALSSGWGLTSCWLMERSNIFVYFVLMINAWIWMELILFKPVSPRRTDRHVLAGSGAMPTSAIATAQRERQEYPGRTHQKVSNWLHENKHERVKGAEKSDAIIQFIIDFLIMWNINILKCLVPVDASHHPWDPLGHVALPAQDTLPGLRQSERQLSRAEGLGGKWNFTFSQTKRGKNFMGFQTYTFCGCYGMAVDCTMVMPLWQWIAWWYRHLNF